MIWPGEVSGVVARAVNLSSTGILVDTPTPTPCPVGSDVLCDVTLPRGSRLLRGRVAHRRLLPSEKVGMGIAFVDLSPREVAELRDVVGECEERPQRVKVRFEGTSQVVRARALATPAGFQLATALPFLKRDTEVDIALSPDESVSARGWVSAVTLDRTNVDGVPRLVIDVEVARRPAEDVVELDQWGVKTPVVEAFSSVPGHVWEPEDLGVRPDPVSSLSLDAPVAAEAMDTPTVVTVGEPLPAIADGPASAPMVVHDGDATEIIPLDNSPERPRLSFGVGMVVGLCVLAVVGLFLVRSRAPQPEAAPPSLAPPAIVTQPPATPPSPAPMPEAPPVAAPAPVAEPQIEAVAPPAPVFSVGLTGTLAGAHRYLLRDPDGVAYNLPHARAAKAFRTYMSPAPGLKNVWVRPLAGGGTHLRFHFTAERPAPRIELHADGVRVLAP